MKIVLSLNNRRYLYDYISMGIKMFILGGKYSFYSSYCFDIEEMKEMIEGYPECSFYVAVNALYDQHMMDDLENYIERLHDIHVKGIVFQDFGVLQIVKEHHFDFDMMYAPETLNTNAMTLKTLKDYGVTSAFLARVIPLEEQVKIQQEAKIPVMIQGHGIEYIAASKRKLLTNYQDAANLEFDVSKDNQLVLQAHDSQYQFYIYEDSFGTHIFSKTRLFTLDLLNHIHDFDYWYIETLMMSDEEAIETASLYSDALNSYEANTYNKDVKEYMNLLYKLKLPLDRGFLFDQTVYKLEDMRKIDNEKRESNH